MAGTLGAGELSFVYGVSMSVIGAQVLPTEKALQLLREGQAGSRDFSAADAASRKLMDSLLKKRASGPTKPTTGQAFYGGHMFRSHSIVLSLLH